MKKHMNENLILTSSRFVKQKEYWLDHFQHGLEHTRFLKESLPAKGNPPDAHPMQTEILELTEQVAADLIQLGKGADLSIYIILLAALQTVVYRYVGISPVAIVSPLYASTVTDETLNDHLLLCNHITGSQSFKEIVLGARESVLDAYANQDYPFGRILRYLDGQSNPTTEEYSSVSLAMTPLHSPLPERLKTALLSINVERGGDGGIKVAASFDPVAFHPDVTRRFLNHWQRLLWGGLDALRSGRCVDRLPLMDDEEERRVVYLFNSSSSNTGPRGNVADLFHNQADARPHQVALLDGQHTLLITYGCLRERVGRLADHLRRQGISSGSIVAIMADDTTNIVLAIMGILSAGGAYLPIDPEYPKERVRLMLRDSGASAILAEPGLDVPADAPPLYSLSPENFLGYYDGSFNGVTIHWDDPAYVMYTSGTTGVPKGVVIEHRNIANLLDWFGETYGLGPGFRVLQLTEYTFDPSVEDIMGSLVWGATIVPGHRELLGDRELFREFVRCHQVNMINFIPTMLEDLLCHGERLPSLKVLICGGEPLGESLKDSLLAKGYNVFNHYGPTETATDAVTGLCGEGDVVLGRPISNTRCYILSRNQFVPIGVAGELCIAGSNVGRGYLNNPQLTDAKFVPDPFFPGQRMYRTGDLARYGEDSSIQYLGRIDRQVKVRGFRIELQEVENQLLRHPAVKEAVVTVADAAGQDSFLCAYIVPRGKDSVAGQPFLDNAAIGEFLAARLPYYMVPSCVIPLRKIPLTSTGKIDRAALPNPGSLMLRQYKAPIGLIEEKMQSIWAYVLKKDISDVSRDDNFFQLGGHSLLVTVLLSRIQREFGVSIPFTDVFKHPTLEALASLASSSCTVGGAREKEGLLLLKEGKPGGDTVFFIHDGTGVAEVYGSACEYLAPETRCFGILPTWRTEIGPQDVTIEELASMYIDTIKHIQPNGPYVIAGWCIGGTIVFEMARRLATHQELGQAVIISALPPDPAAVSYDESFSTAGEQALLKEYMAEFRLPANESRELDVNGLWRHVAAYLHRQPVLARALKKNIPGNWARTIPHFDASDAETVCRYLNTIRSLYNARNRYIPTGEVVGSIHYIQPRGDNSNLDVWKTFARNEVLVFDVGGDHYSLFEEPTVQETAMILKKIFEK